MNIDPIKCADCGKFIKHSDIESGNAQSNYDNHMSICGEVYEDIYFLCPKHKDTKQ